MGEEFVGTCWQCGKKGITLKQFVAEECENPAGFTQDESLILAVEGAALQEMDHGEQG